MVNAPFSDAGSSIGNPNADNPNAECRQVESPPVIS